VPSTLKTVLRSSNPSELVGASSVAANTDARRVPGDRNDRIWNRWLRSNLIQVNWSVYRSTQPCTARFAKETVGFSSSTDVPFRMQRPLHIRPVFWFKPSSLWFYCPRSIIYLLDLRPSVFICNIVLSPRFLTVRPL
jgi:hypothetical protein